MIIEVVLDGQGAVRVEADQVMTRKQITRLIDHASATITQAQSKGKPREGYGFGSGSSLVIGHGADNQDPYEFGHIVRPPYSPKRGPDDKEGHR